MSRSSSTIRSYLYVAGNDPRRVEKALTSKADAVVLDLEDAVAPKHKDDARRTVEGMLKHRNPKPVFVRVNAPGGPLRELDIEAVLSPNLAGIRLPKTESAAEVLSVAERLDESGCVAGIQCLIESALGLEMAFEISRSHSRVASLGLGEADIASDLGVSGDEGLLYSRSRIVSAARAAGLAAPVQSVFTNIGDLDGLRRSTEAGKRLGFVGRSAIHPAQIPIINEVFTPTEQEISEAEGLLSRLESTAESGMGVFVMDNGRFVDAAVVRGARSTLALARRSGQTLEAR